MNNRLKKYAYRAIVILGITAVAGMWAAESHGFFGCFQRRWDTAAAMYGSTTCSGQQVVANYVPQTSYRVQYCPVAVTTYRPVTTADPCTGCQTTCLRPITCYRQQAQLVPYQSYRIVYSTLQPACAVPATTYYSATAPAVVPATGCGSCGSSPAAASYTVPSTTPATIYGAAPAVAVPGYTTTPAPSLPVTTQYAPSAVAAPSATYPAIGTYPPSASQPTVASPGYTTIPASPSYSSPLYSSPATSAPSLPLSTPSSAPGAVLSAPTPAPALSPSAAVDPNAHAAAVITSPLVPVPDMSISGAAAPTMTTTNGGGASPQLAAPLSTTSYYTAPGYSSGVPATAPPATAPSVTPPVRNPYSSGIVPAAPTPSATGVPMFVPAPTATPMPTPGASPSASGRAIMPTPIPDPETYREGPRLGPTTSSPSSPSLVDPQDKTAVAWPTERAWNYTPIAALPSHTTTSNVSTVSYRGPAAEVDSTVRLGAPIIVQQPAPVAVSAPVVAPRPLTDADGWRASNR